MHVCWRVNKGYAGKVFTSREFIVAFLNFSRISLIILTAMITLRKTRKWFPHPKNRSPATHWGFGFESLSCHKFVIASQINCYKTLATHERLGIKMENRLQNKYTIFTITAPLGYTTNPWFGAVKRWKDMEGCWWRSEGCGLYNGVRNEKKICGGHV